MCQDCFTLRSKSRGMGSHRSAGGIIIDMHTNQTLCSSCFSSNIHPINPCGKIVTSPSLMDKCVQSVVVCVRCKILTLYSASVTIGNTQLCLSCYQSACGELQPTTCFCGVELSIRTLNPTTFCAISERGEIALYSACDKHVSCVPRSSELVHIESIYGACGLV